MLKQLIAFFFFILDIFACFMESVVWKQQQEEQHKY